MDIKTNIGVLFALTWGAIHFKSITLGIGAVICWIGFILMLFGTFVVWKKAKAKAAAMGGIGAKLKEAMEEGK